MSEPYRDICESSIGRQVFFVCVTERLNFTWRSKKKHYFWLAILPILSTSIEIGSYSWTFYEIIIYHFMIIINNNWKSFLLRHIKQINSNELWLIRLVPMEHSVPRKMKSYAPLSQVNANENQELKGIFEFGISTLHFCSPFTTCSTYMLFW